VGDRRVRSLGVTAPGRPAILDLTEPEPADGQAWVSTIWSGVSAGTEVALVRGGDPHHQVGWDPRLRVFGTGARSGYPIAGIGYMEVGRVTESRTPALPEGQLVAMAYGHRTGHCVDPARQVVVPVPDDLDPVLGVYLAQMGPICVNGLLHAAAEVAGPSADIGDGVRSRHVLVTGAGVVGLLTALLAHRHGAASVTVADPSRERLDVARRLGLGTVVDDDGAAWRTAKQDRGLGPGECGADVAFQCRGHAGSLVTALKSLRPQGSVIDLGFYQAGAGDVHLGEEFHHNGLTIRCAQIGRVPRGMAGAWDRGRLASVTLDLLRDRSADLRRHLVTDVVDFADGADLLSDVAAHRRSVLTAVLSFFPPDEPRADPAGR
jgi:threonine dehydrogenase-like Zn-dependent dehydrogenase